MVRRSGTTHLVTTVALIVVLATAGLPSVDAQEPDAQENDDLVSLVEILERTDTRFQWDPYRRRGAFVRGSAMLSFALDTPVAVENLTTVYRVEPPRRSEGTLFFSRGFLNIAQRVFPPVEQIRRIAGIFIDPGHGGKDPGAIGTFSEDGASRTVREKDVVLAVGAELRDLLSERYPNKEIVMSRDTDRYLTLEERTTLANGIETESNETVVFVSIHANASLNRGARGFEVWFLPPEFRRRNLVDAEETGVDDPDLLTILNTMREEEITIESILLARNVLAGIEAEVGEYSPNRGLREESWYVVRNAKMPSILVEVGFVTNPDESKRLQDAAYLRRVTEGIYTGVINFIRSYEELGTQ